MAQWQYKIDVKDIHAAYKETGDVEALKASMAKECRGLAEKVEFYTDKGHLRDIADDYDAADDIDACDNALERLYN